MKMRRLLPWTLALSFLLHGVAYASLRAAPPSHAPEHRKTQLRFDVVTRTAPPKPPKPVAPLRQARAAAPKPLAPAEPLPQESPSPPASTDGVTLAAEGSRNSFSMPLGNGGQLEPTAPPRALTPVNVPAPTPSAPTRVVTEPPVVAVGDLSSRPSPPSLAEALQRNYPADARQRGQSGAAKVRARIEPDGVVRRVELLEESGAGFGAACRRTLSGSRWAAPKDKAGRPVATEIRYTCRFVVQ
jgi:periplasmic protein TonB